jgi:hypothetical protein
LTGWLGVFLHKFPQLPQKPSVPRADLVWISASIKSPRSRKHAIPPSINMLTLAVVGMSASLAIHAQAPTIIPARQSTSKEMMK